MVREGGREREKERSDHCNSKQVIVTTTRGERTKRRGEGRKKRKGERRDVLLLFGKLDRE